MKIVVYTVGTFDLLHVGHLALLNHCKKLGDILAVGVASDEVVNMYKPNVPIVPLEQRIEMLRALACVDIDIFVVGEDWGKKPHNLDVDNYIRDIGKQIEQVHYNTRTSSTKIKQMVLAQHEPQSKLTEEQLHRFARYKQLPSYSFAKQTNNKL